MSWDASDRKASLRDLMVQVRPKGSPEKMLGEARRGRPRLRLGRFRDS